MKKTIICDIPMKKGLSKCVYASQDRSVPSSSEAVIFPINTFLSNTLTTEDEVKVILLVKRDEAGQYKLNAEKFLEEFSAACEWKVASVDIKTIETDYSEERIVHEQLLGEIIDAIDDESHVIADITYGPKDLPIVLFTALNFAEKHLNCEIDNIIFGQVDFVNGQPTNAKLCDMVPLYTLNSVASEIRCDEPSKARRMLKALLSL